MSDYLMGLDVGGGSGRCLLLEVGSGVVTTATRQWSFAGAPGTAGFGSELDLDLIWRELAQAVRETLARAGAEPGQIAGIAATALRFGSVILDRDREAIFAVPNRDARAAGEGLRLAVEHGEALHARTGIWPMPIQSLARLQWLAANAPDLLARADALMSINDWVTFRLCGALATEPSQAGCTGLFGLEDQKWAWDWIEQLELPRGLFPEVANSGDRLGSLSADAARALGLQAGIPIAVGGGDTQCGLLGAGAVAPGDAAAVAGTSAPVVVVLEAPRRHPEGRLWAGHHVVPGRFVLESNAGPLGEALAWFATLLYPDTRDPIARLFAEAGTAEPGSAGMLSSLGAEVMNARQPMMPVGHLALSHLASLRDASARRHLARSVIEGQACALRANLDQLREASGVDLAMLRMTGGLTQSDLFTQLVSDVLGAPIEVSACSEASALGAAFCAGVGAGVYPDLVSAAKHASGARAQRRPDPTLADVHAKLYSDWSQLRSAREQAAGPTASSLATSWALAANDATSVATRIQARPRILVTADFDEGSLERLRELGHVEYASFRKEMRLLTGPGMVDALAGVEVFITEVDIVDAQVIAQLPDLRVVASCRGDAVNVDVDACSAFGIPVLNAPGRNAEAVADLTLAFLLMLARKLPEASTFLREPDLTAGDMGKMGQAFSRFQGAELGPRCVGLVGLGAVGRQVARRLRAFGTRILVSDPYVDAGAAALLGAEAVSLERLLDQSDFVSLHAAVRDETRGLIGAAAFARMKPGACLINTARAALVDEDALLEALTSGRLAGAALDAFAVEPPGADHPLLAHANVIATPHLGGNTLDVASHQGSIIACDLTRLLQGEAPQHALNPEIAGRFDWSAPRPEVSAEQRAELSRRPGPTVSDT